MTRLLGQRFAAVRLVRQHSLPVFGRAARLFAAFGGRAGQAGVKVLLSYDYGTGQLQPMDVLPGKCSDQGLAERVAQEVGPQELGIWDKGFYKAGALRRVAQRGLTS